MAIDQQFLDAVIAQNQAAGVTWVAGATSMLALTSTERAGRLGYVPGPGEPSLSDRERLSAANLSRHQPPLAAGLPTAIDWRNVGDKNYVSSVKDQGQCGSCVAFGTAATIDAAARVTTKIAVSDWNGSTFSDLSEAQLFFCNGESTCGTGWYPSAALGYASSAGLAPESAFPYTDHDQACALHVERKNEVTKVGSSSTLTDITEMKRRLATTGPLVTGFTVYNDFFAYSGGVYRWNQQGSSVGGHCVCVIGYDESQQAWICKNSWGTGWGMSGFFLIGYGQCGIDAVMWSIDSFAQIFLFPKVLFDSGDMGEGPGAITWLVGDVNRDRQTEICQLWDNSDRLGMIIYTWNGSAMTELWNSTNVGEGPGAVSWLIGDVNGDGQAEICQLWDNDGRLGMIIYTWNGSAMTELWNSTNVGEGPGAVSWLIGDVNGDGKAEICQQWNNSGPLGMIVYGWNGSAMGELFNSTDMGQGAGAVSWLIGDVNGDGNAEICQQWDNSGSLGMIVYGWNGSSMSTLTTSPNVGQGSGAVAWLIGDVNGDRNAEICQPWNNNGSLGLIVYGATVTPSAN
jgi:C1A family cysteine protease